MEKPTAFITPTAFLSQVNEVSLRVGQCYTMEAHSMVLQIMPEDFGQSSGLDGLRLVALAIKKPPQQVSLSAAPSPLCSPPLPLPLCDCSRALIDISVSVILHAFGHYAFSL